MAQIIYTIKGLSKAHNQKLVFKDMFLSFYEGAKIGVLGMNGSGKSTLLKILAGVDKDYTGEAFARDGAKIGYLQQEPELDPDKTVKEIVSEGMQEIVDLLKEFEQIGERFAQDMTPDEMDKLIARQAVLQEKIEASDGWNLDNKLDVAMDALRCPPSEAKVGVLSGGEKRRVALCRLLLQQPDILLLDEPTNHLDAESVGWLERHLAEYPGMVVAVTHDRYFLDNVAQWILELDRGAYYPFEGNYTGWLEQKRKRIEMEEKGESKRAKTLDRELDWIKQGPRARQAKSKARIQSYEALLTQDSGQKTEELEIYIPAGPRLGEVVIDAKEVAKSFGDTLLYDNMTFNLPRGGIVGIIGPNGAGKTTLFKMVTGKDQPDKGVIRVGDTVKLSYVDQNRENLDPNKSIFEAITGGEETVRLGTREVPSRQYVSRFGFSGNDQQKKVGILSGGERNRVNMAKMLKEGGNVILLDEPSNDLDVNTLRALEEALVNFGGCAVVISHDRWFLDRIATHILAFEGDSKVVWFEGNYQDYEADRKKRLGVDADQPHRIKYKKLTH